MTSDEPDWWDSVDPLWETDYPDYPEDEPEDEEEEALLNCGMTHTGQCMQAGTEFCDFDCPIGSRPRVPRKQGRRRGDDAQPALPFDRTKENGPDGHDD